MVVCVVEWEIVPNPVTPRSFCSFSAIFDLTLDQLSRHTLNSRTMCSVGLYVHRSRHDYECGIPSFFILPVGIFFLLPRDSPRDNQSRAETLYYIVNIVWIHKMNTFLEREKRNGSGLNPNTTREEVLFCFTCSCIVISNNGRRLCLGCVGSMNIKVDRETKQTSRKLLLFVWHSHSEANCLFELEEEEKDDTISIQFGFDPSFRS